MNKSHYKEWKVEYKGQEIKVTNWWSWSRESSADLFINDKHVDRCDEVLANPNISVLNVNQYSEDIKTLKVYFAGAFIIKVLIMVNGENVFQDKLSTIDRLVNKVFPKD
ncbi:uncharacterized protein METZ01_LOCUS265576 [marine metagenome]|uniref:Uncharacterized protein n=1 Tax=marine metagenome TaxID=408172 RepID=A0A382JN04_9ZZZZ